MNFQAIILDASKFIQKAHMYKMPVEFLMATKDALPGKIYRFFPQRDAEPIEIMESRLLIPSRLSQRNLSFFHLH